MILVPVLTTSLIHFSLKGWENVLFELGTERVKTHTEFWMDDIPLSGFYYKKNDKKDSYQVAGVIVDSHWSSCLQNHAKQVFSERWFYSGARNLLKDSLCLLKEKDEVLDKLRKYDKMMADDVELR